jgi:predicted  nucleic acid-binding Zn-ribbon protein
MTQDDPIPTLAEVMAEIRRLRERSAELEADNEGLDEIIIDQAKVITSLRERVAELEAASAMERGTLAQPSDDGPATITHGHAPSAPPHNE